LTGIHQRTAPTKINRTDWNDLITFLGGTSSDPQIDATKILLAQGGSLLSTWRYASDLTKMDAAKVAGNIAAAQMQTNVLAAIIAAGGIVNDDVNAAAGISKSKISTTSTWATADLPAFPTASVAMTSDFNTTSDTFVDVTGSSVSITPPTGWKVFAISKVCCWSDVAGHAMNCRLVYGVTPTELNRVYVPTGIDGSYRQNAMIDGIVSGLSGATTFKLQANRDQPAGSANVGNFSRVDLIAVP